MYSKPAVGLVSLAGRRGGGQNIALPVELHPPFGCRVDDRTRTDNRCMPTGSRRGQFQRTQRRGAESPALLPQPPESVLRRTAVGTRSSSRRDLEGHHYLGRPRIATLGLSCTPNRQLSRDRRNPPSRWERDSQRSNWFRHRGKDVIRTGSWPSETPVGVEPTFAGLQPAAWPSGSSVKYPRQESNLICDLRRVVCDPPHPEDENIPARIRTGIQTLDESDVAPLHHQDERR